MPSSSIRRDRLSTHVVRFAVPTPTLPPSFETNTYLIHAGAVGIMVDAGSDDPHLLNELLAAVRAEGVTRVEALIATHYHPDHTQGLPYLQQHLTAPIHIHELDLAPAVAILGTSADCAPVRSAYAVNGLAIRIQHQPGHTHGHIHIVVDEDRVILVGDHLAGDGSVWIGPPDGHMASYFAALRAIEQSGCTIAGPGHGDVSFDAPGAARTLLTRRQAREAEILRLVSTGPQSLAGMVSTLYAGTVPPDAMWVARKTVQAHLQHLIEQGKVRRCYVPEQGFVYSDCGPGT